MDQELFVAKYENFLQAVYPTSLLGQKEVFGPQEGGVRNEEGGKSEEGGGEMR